MGRHRSRSASRSRSTERHRRKRRSPEDRERRSRRDKSPDRSRDKDRRKKRDRESSTRARHVLYRSGSPDARKDQHKARRYRFDSPPRELPESPTKPAPPVILQPSPAPRAPAPPTIIAPVVVVPAPPPPIQQGGLSPDFQKAAKELYVGNLPPGVDVNQLVEFLNAAIVAINANKMPGPAATKAWISADGHYAFVEFRSMEEATGAMQLNGLNCLGYALKIGRPKTFPPELQTYISNMQSAQQSMQNVQAIQAAQAAQVAQAAQSVQAMQTTHTVQIPPAPTTPVQKPPPPPVPSMDDARAQAAKAAAVISGAVIPSDERLCLVNIPKDCADAEVAQLIMRFGPVKHMQYFKGSEQGVCVFEYQDQTHQTLAQKALEGFSLHGCALSVMKAELAAEKGLLEAVNPTTTAFCKSSSISCVFMLSEWHCFQPEPRHKCPPAFSCSATSLPPMK
eukprot:GHVU01057736.1.p1 GENE.GHVU01057736.1~~GHVU01057736.1.p1  ORF type:complete len:452 (-),score=35.75 GHVU01057736.1:1526-2881(-)